MKAFKIISVVIIFSILNWAPAGFSQKKAAKEQKTKRLQESKKQEKLRLELPDVFIYGMDTKVRLVGDKLKIPEESVKLIKPVIDYQPQVSEKEVQGEKDYLKIEKELTRSATQMSVNYGRFNQANVNALRWQEGDRIDYALRGSYQRNQGQYPNSQFWDSLLKLNLGYHLSSKVKPRFAGAYRIYDYGLHGAITPDHKRKLTSWRGEGTLNLFSNNTTYGSIQLILQQLDLANESNTSPVKNIRERNWEFNGEFTTPLSQCLWLTKVHFQRNSFECSTDSATSYSLARVRTQLFIPLGYRLSANLGLKWETFVFENNESKNKFSPFGEVIFSPLTALGFYLKGSRGFRYFTYQELWESNRFLKDNIELSPEEVVFEIEAGAEVKLTGAFLAKLSLVHQKIKNYGYWERNSDDGLFQYQRLNEIQLFELGFSAEMKLAEKFTLSTGIHLYSDDASNNQLFSISNQIPYRARYIASTKLYYQISPGMQLSLSSQLLGPRKVKLGSEEELDQSMVVSAQVTKKLSQHISLFIEGYNLTDQKYELWEGYPEFGISFIAGINGAW